MPLPDPAVDQPAAAASREPRLLDQVRAVVRAARDLYRALAVLGARGHGPW